MPVFDKAQSKIKMVILTKGKAKNVIWWSPIKHNKRIPFLTHKWKQLTKL